MLSHLFVSPRCGELAESGARHLLQHGPHHLVPHPAHVEGDSPVIIIIIIIIIVYYFVIITRLLSCRDLEMMNGSGAEISGRRGVPECGDSTSRPSSLLPNPSRGKSETNDCLYKEIFFCLETNLDRCHYLGRQ